MILVDWLERDVIALAVEESEDEVPVELNVLEDVLINVDVDALTEEDIDTSARVFLVFVQNRYIYIYIYI